jgi:hypothetical protein
MDATNPVPSARLSNSDAISVQAPLPKRVMRDGTVDAAAWRYIELPTDWAGCACDVVADTGIWWMCTGGTVGAPSPVPDETVSAITEAALNAAAVGIPARLAADTPAFFTAHPDRMVLAHKGVAAGTDIRVVQR